mgnify:CR=1 FL=1
MRFKVQEGTHTMERELIGLLTDLCAKWGFCIPPDHFEQITKRDFYHADDFALDVIEAKGMDIHSQWTNKIAERFKERFGADIIDSLTFTDRIRGQ